MVLETCTTESILEKPSRYVFKLSDYEKKTFAYSKKVTYIVLVNAEISYECFSWCVAALKIFFGVLKKYFCKWSVLFISIDIDFKVTLLTD